MGDVADGPVVADTDLVVDFFRGSGPGADAVERWLRDGVLRLTAVTAYELRIGTSFLEQGPTIGRLLLGRTLPLDTRAGLRAGEIAVRLREHGRPIGVADTLQAGICLRYEVPLGTRDTRHFERVAGLRLAALEADGES